MTFSFTSVFDGFNSILCILRVIPSSKCSSHCWHRSFHWNAVTTTNERRNGRKTNKPTRNWATNSIESHQQSYSAWNWIYCHKIFAWLLLHDSPGDSNLNAKTDRTQHSLNSIKRPSKAIEDAIGRNSKQISTWNRMMQKANLNVSLLKMRQRGIVIKITGLSDKRAMRYKCMALIFQFVPFFYSLELI